MLLVAYLFLFELNKPPEEEKKENVFPAIEELKIEEIRLNYPLNPLLIRKEGGSWYFVKDSRKYKANSNIISSMIDDLSNMKIDKIISEKPGDIIEFGLKDPRVEVIARTPDKRYRLLIGGEAPVGSGAYIQVGDENDENKVLLVDKGEINTVLDHSENDLRDKQVLALNQENIKGMRFKSNDSSFELSMKDGEWVANGTPEFVQIDQDRVSAILTTFLNLKIDGFEDDEPKNLSAYGLSEPSAEIEMFVDGKSIRVLFGDKKENEDYYVKLGSESSVYSVSKFVFVQIPEDVNDIRVRKIIDLDSEKVSGVEITEGETNISLIKKGGDWNFEDNGSLKANKTQVDEFLEKVENLEVEKFVDDNPKDLTPYELDKPRIRVTISEPDKKITLLFGKREDGKVYIKLADGKSVYLLGDDILSKIPSKDE